VSSLTRFSEWLLRQPVVWGGLASMAFYALVVEQAEPGSLVATAFTGNQWQFKAAASLLCFAGLAALMMRLLNLAVQFGALERRALPPTPAAGHDVADVGMLLAELDAAPSSFQSTYIAHRLRRALELVRQRDSADAIEADLRSLADEDQAGIANRYAALRLTAACIPLLGVAGAAAGIAIAFGDLSGKTLDSALPGVLAGVGLACGGVVQAAALTIVLCSLLGVQR
jgi:biopolymer transport protein ExbB/TolQ